MNTVILSGNLVEDPKIQHTSNDKPYCWIRLAVNGPKDKADFFRIKAWDKTAELCTEYLVKGSKVLVEGRINNDNYEKDGTPVYQDTITANRVEFLSSKGDN